MRRTPAQRLAETIGGILVWLLPPGRRGWGEAMRREIEEIDRPKAALAFALGCGATCIIERMREMEMILRTGRWVAIGGMLFLALAAFASAVRLMPDHRQTAFLFGLLSLAWAVSALWSMLGHARALIQAAAGLLAAYALAFLLLRAAEAGAMAWRPQPIHHALNLEGLVLSVMLLGVGLFVLRRAGPPLAPGDRKAE